MDTERHLCVSRKREEQSAPREPPRSDDRAFPRRPGVQLRIGGDFQTLKDVHFCCSPTGLPNVSPCTEERSSKSLPSYNRGGIRVPSCGGRACSIRPVIAANIPSQWADENFAIKGACRCVSRLLLGHCFGAFPAPGGTPSSASRCAPFGVPVPPKTSLRTTAKNAAQTSFEPLRESRSSALGAGPTR